MGETDITRCRIGKNYFDDRDEAEAWVEAGNVGGVYSIIYQVFCPDHLDWFDEAYDRVADEHICSKCFQRRQEERNAERRTQLELENARETERRKLAAWNEGRPIVPYVSD